MSAIARNVVDGAWDDVALCDEHVALTWREVDAVLNRTTNGILAAVPPDRRVGVFARNSAHVALAHIAALAAGRSSVPISSYLTASELAYILRDGSVDLLFAGPECAKAAREAVREVGRGSVVAWRSDPGPDGADWDAWLDAQSAEEPPQDMPPQPHLHYTSGTTGTPKAVETPPTMFPRCETVAVFFAAMADEVRETGCRVCLGVAPLYHTSPMRLVRALAGGAKLVTMARFDAEAVLHAIATHKIERSVMVPTHFRRMLALPNETRAAYDVSSLKFISHTGASCPADVKEAMIDWVGPILTEFYGGTETGPATKIDSHEALAHPGSAGRAAPPYEALIVDDEGTELPAGSEGRLFFRDTSGRGIIYANDPEKTRAAHIAPATFTLGDMGMIDEDGYVFITDRASDMIVSGGVNIYPAEIEQVLARHPAIEDAAVIGVPDEDMGEAVKALVVPRKGTQAPDAAALDAFCRKELAAYKCPRSFDLVETVGRNAMGKISKRALRRPFWPTDRTIG